MKPSEIKNEVVARLGINEDNYNKEIFESGIVFIEFLCGDAEWHRELISRHPKFWEWWSNQFQLADYRLLTGEFNFEEWLNMHTPKGYLYSPNYPIFEKTYEELINEINKDLQPC